MTCECLFETLCFLLRANVETVMLVRCDCCNQMQRWAGTRALRRCSPPFVSVDTKNRMFKGHIDRTFECNITSSSVSISQEGLDGFSSNLQKCQLRFQDKLGKCWRSEVVVKWHYSVKQPAALVLHIQSHLLLFLT